MKRQTRTFNVIEETNSSTDTTKKEETENKENRTNKQETDSKEYRYIQNNDREPRYSLFVHIVTFM